MDTKPTLTYKPSVLTETGVVCEQAVFTSVRSAMGQGYQLIAASAGLTVQEKKEITRKSPTHGGLCETTPDAMALAYYPLPSNRMALAFSFDAGAEHTGRGARRIYTHIAIVSPDAMSYFNYNPFDWLRSIEATGAYEIDLKPPKTLEPLHVSPGHWSVVEESAEATGNAGAHWIAYIVMHLLDHETLLVGTKADPFALAESVFMGIPGPVRAEISMSVGLRFSASRKYQLAIIQGTTQQAQRLTKGQNIEWLQPASDSPTPHAHTHPWSEMVQLCARNNHWDDLARLTARDFSDTSDTSLSRIGLFAIDLFSARQAELPELFSLASVRVGQDGTNEIESDILLKLVLALQTRICEQLRLDAVPRKWWEPVMNLLTSSQRTADFAHPLAANLIDRQADTNPLDALMMIKEVWQLSRSTDVRIRIMDSINRTFSMIPQCVPDMNFEALEQLRNLLNEWPMDLAPDCELGDIYAGIDARLFNNTTS